MNAARHWHVGAGDFMSSALSVIPEHLQPVAILHQAGGAPVIGGLRKPMKPGGYRDSSADIAFALRNAGVKVVLPIEGVEPDAGDDKQWAFGDTIGDIEAARKLGARTLWANTVLHSHHALASLSGVYIVGQKPDNVQKFDDKWLTNRLLEEAGCPVARALRISQHGDLADVTIGQVSSELLAEYGLRFPVVVKPVRGRGSEGVVKVDTLLQLREEAASALASTHYGDTLIIEEYLPGKEVTVSVMPAGSYWIDGKLETKWGPWGLPPVLRFNHHNGIAPYNGTVAVMHNSEVISETELASVAMQNLLGECERAASLVGAVAPIRVDCRRGEDSEYRLFDLNMKPNMTGVGRPGREEQDSLTCLAARSIGWSYSDLLLNMLRQAWLA